MSERSVSLVCMPFHLLEAPSIQLGILEGTLARQGIAAQSHSFHLAFVEFLRASTRDPLTLAEYEELATTSSNTGAGEWLFARAPFVRLPSTTTDDAFAKHLKAQGLPWKLVNKLRMLRSHVPAFVETCAEEILRDTPAIVGFSTVYAQTLPSIALANALRRRVPDLVIVFGGANVEDSMGPALMTTFDEIDYVVRGEGEHVFGTLTKHVLEGEPVPNLPGLCRRRHGEVVAHPSHPSERVDIDELPLPRYREYFDRLRQGSLRHDVLPRIPYQSSRGCWWGERHHCTFCGLNGTDMAFRSKQPLRVLTEVEELSRAHRVVDFLVVDNILDHGYLDTLIPELARTPHDLSFFCETKSNLSAQHVARLGAAGVRTIQPGIESLSTPILKLMNKGVSALQNVRFLKACAAQGIHVIWNVIYGFPGEPEEEYARMAELVPSLSHLPPPDLVPLVVARFSPYHQDPDRHGLVLRGPLPHYGLLYDADPETVANLAQAFEHEYLDGRRPEQYVANLREAIDRWRRTSTRDLGSLTYRRGPDHLAITDTRTVTGRGVRYVLEGQDVLVHTLCEHGSTPLAIQRHLKEATGKSMDTNRLRNLLQDLVDARLMMVDGERHLSLALPAAASWGHQDSTTKVSRNRAEEQDTERPEVRGTPPIVISTP